MRGHKSTVRRGPGRAEGAGAGVAGGAAGAGAGAGRIAGCGAWNDGAAWTGTGVGTGRGGGLKAGAGAGFTVTGRDWTAAGGSEMVGAGLGLGAKADGAADGADGGTAVGWGKACGTGREGAVAPAGTCMAGGEAGEGFWTGADRKASGREGVAAAGTWIPGGGPAGRDGTPAPGTTTVRVAGAAMLPGVAVGGSDPEGIVVVAAGSGRERGVGAGAGRPSPAPPGAGAIPLPGPCDGVPWSGFNVRVSGGRDGFRPVPDGTARDGFPGTRGVEDGGAVACGGFPGRPTCGRAGGVTVRVARSVGTAPPVTGAGRPGPVEGPDGGTSDEAGAPPAAVGGAGRFGLSDPPSAGTGSGRLAEGVMPMRSPEGARLDAPGARSGAGRVSSWRRSTVSGGRVSWTGTLGRYTATSAGRPPPVGLGRPLVAAAAPAARPWAAAGLSTSRRAVRRISSRV